jgi:hypothetical protein
VTQQQETLMTAIRTCGNSWAHADSAPMPTRSADVVAGERAKLHLRASLSALTLALDLRLDGIADASATKRRRLLSEIGDIRAKLARLVESGK